MQLKPTKILSKVLNILVILYLLISIAFGVKLTYSHFPRPMDFGSFLASGLQAQSGSDPYTFDHPLVFQVPITAYHLIIPSPNLNPPISILPFDILSRLSTDPAAAGMAWKSFSLFLYLFFVYWLIKTYPHNSKWITILWIFSLAGFWQTIEVGQIYVPLLITTFLAWRCLEEEKSILAGFFIGILTAIKPQFILWAIFLWLIKRPHVFISSAITALVASAIPVLIFGTDIYRQWLTALSKYDGILLPGNMSILSLFSHLGLKTVGSVTGTLLLLSIVIYTMLKQPHVLTTSYISIAVTLLISPYSWSGYSLFLLPAFFSSKKWSWKKTISAFLLAFPFAFVIEYFTKNPLLFITLGWVYGWAIIILLWDGIVEVHNNDQFSRIAARPTSKEST